jgi:Ca-activated chloride channel family protein
MLEKEDFNDDKKDAGEIGAGHTVTALYEIAPPGSAEFERAVDPLKYQAAPGFSRAAGGGEILTLKVRYKEPAGSKSRLLEFPVVDAGMQFEEASADFKFAAAVAQFGMILRDSEHKGSATLDDVRKLAGESIGADEYGHRREFAGLVFRALALLQDDR